MNNKQLDAALFSLLAYGRKKENIARDLIILSYIGPFTSELYTFLQEKGFLDKATSLDSIRFLFEVKEGYYILPKLIKTHLKSLQENYQIPNNLGIELIEHYKNNELKLQDEENIDVYIAFYEQAINFLKQDNPAILLSFLMEYTESILRSERFFLIKNIFYELLTNLRNKERSGTSTALSQAYILCGLFQIEKRENNLILASRIANDCFQILDNIENITDEELKNSLTHYCLFERSDLRFRMNDYNYAWEDALRANQLINDLNSLIFLVSLTRYVGYYYQSECLLHQLYNRLYAQSMEIKEIWFNSLHYETVRYLFEVDLIDEAIALIEEVQRKERKGYKSERFEQAFNCYLSMCRSKKIIQKKSDIYKKANITLDKTNRVHTILSKTPDKFEALKFIWLAKAAIADDKPDDAQVYLSDAWEILSKTSLPNSKEYFDWYLTQYDLKKVLGDVEDLTETLTSLYQAAEWHLGIYHPILIEITMRMESVSKDAQHNPLLRIEYINRLINPSVRTEHFDIKHVDNRSSVTTQIRTSRLSFIPDRDDEITLKNYTLPFFDSTDLVELSFTKGYLKQKRFFLYENESTLIFLSDSNSAVYEAAKTRLKTDEKNLVLYIKFFFDVVIGRYGRFYVIEDFDRDIPWSHYVGDAEKRIQIDRLRQFNIKPISFLYEEVLVVDEEQVKVWHFSLYLLFKDSLFSSKAELNDQGVIRLYDEKLLLEELPIACDFKSTFTLFE